MTIHGLDLWIPSGHPLPSVLRTEPFRENLLAVAARYAFSSNRDEYIDVGANIGDTAALVRREAITFPPSMVLVEPSRFFAPYLLRNAEVIGDAVVVQRFVAVQHPIESLSGFLNHWGGTALFKASDSAEITRDSQVDLIELISTRTALVKIDCDGLDLEILETSLERLAANRPQFLFENTLTTIEDYARVERVMEVAVRLGYGRIVIAHYCGALLYAGPPGTEMWDVFRFQMNMIVQGRHSVCFYTDVLLVHNTDESKYIDMLHALRVMQEPKIGLSGGLA